MNPADAFLKPRKRNFRFNPAAILTLAVVVALVLFARAPAGAPATPWETIVQKHYAPIDVIDGIVASPVEGFGPAQLATGDGGQ